MSYKHYARDPYWTTAKFDTVDAEGKPLAKGTRCFYFPATRSYFQGDAAERESAAFVSAAQDEAFMTGEY